MKFAFSRCGACAPLFLAGLLLVPAASEAAPIVYEGFDYPADSSLYGNAGGYGWTGTWQTVNNGTATMAAGSLSAEGISPPGYAGLSVGNSCHLPNARRVGRRVDTSASGPLAAYRNGDGRIGADGTTIYISFLQQADGTTKYYEFELHRGDLGDPGRIAGIGNDQGGNDVQLRAPNGTHTLIGAGDTAVNFYVMRIDFKPGNDDVYVYRNPTSATEPGTPTLAAPGVADMSFDGISLGAFDSTRTVMHDEIRVGASWADVTAPAAAQPQITRQPRATTTSFEGGSVVLHAAASGMPLPSYQWLKGDTPLEGQTGSSLSLSHVTAADAGSYRLRATNAQGTATSDPAQVIVEEAPAGLLAYEGFDYDPGTSNLTGNGGGLGWSGGWNTINGGGTSVTQGNLTAGTNGPGGYDDESLGNSNFVPNNFRDGRYLDTSPGGRFDAAGYVDANGNIGADGKTLYISFMQQPNGTSLFYEFEFHRGDLGDPGRIGGIGNDTQAANVGLRTGGTTTTVGPGSTSVNLYVVRIDFKAGNDDVYVYQNPLAAGEPTVPTLTKLDASDMSFNGISLAAFVNGRTVNHDEIRIGQSWSDVMFGTSRRELSWVGDGTSNLWNTTAANWNGGSGATTFSDGDAVVFNDAGSNAPAVGVPGAVSTSLVTFGNSIKGYTLGGTGPVNSSGGLVKFGTGPLTVNAPLNLGNALVVEGGSLTLNGTTNCGADLNFTGDVLTLAGEGTFVGSLNVTQGYQTLSGTNTFSGLVSTNGNFTLTGRTSIVGTGGTTVWFGNLPGANTTLTIEEGGELNITGTFRDAWVIGRDGGSGSVVHNGGTIVYNPGNHPEAFIGASATSTETVASYQMNGGVLDMSNTRLGLAIGPITSRLDQNGGEIKVRQMELGSNLPQGTGIYSLVNGTLTVGAGGMTSTSGLYEINLAGGTIKAAADWTSSLKVTLTGSTAFDIVEHEVSLFGDIVGTGELVKTGQGTLVLGGFNTFGGRTLVNAGTLAGFGNSDFSAMTVAAGATVSPGHRSIGDFFCGSATFENGSRLELEISGAGLVSDSLVMFGNLDIRGATVSFTKTDAEPIPQGTELVIVDYSDGSLTGTFPGLPEGAVVTVGLESYVIHYANGSRVTLTATEGTASPYLSWAAANGLDGTAGKDPAFDADADLDGIANGLEWVLGGAPLAQDAAGRVAATGNAVDGLTLSFTRAEESIGNATLVVQWSTSLDGTWTDIPITQAGDGTTVIVDQNATPDAVTVRIPASNAAGGKLFARLRATAP